MKPRFKAEPITKRVNVGTVNLRSTPEISDNVIFTVDKGTAVTVLSNKDGWSKIQKDDTVGFIMSQYLS